MDAETFKKLIHPPLKERGFKRSGATWRLQQPGSVAVLNVQRSSWGGGDFYVNLGVYFSEIGTDPSPTENKCHVQFRLDVEDPLVVAEKAASWFAERSRLQDAARLAESDSKKGLVFKEVRSALQA
ncbi:DUF4304 domain-containing protein [Pseudoduganella sp.]|uniref:DUF4304 domain-containing protein n=1 Tax=Pseudoduganella sp. TaxID=1880898 RepID=UPI0035B0F104